jgi:hypothetical protein
LLTRAVQNSDCVFTGGYRTATVRELAPDGLFQQPARSVYDMSMMSKLKRSGGRYEIGEGLRWAQVSKAVVATLELR